MKGRCTGANSALRWLANRCGLSKHVASTDVLVVRVWLAYVC
jgi:hypothetical protein